MGNNLVPHSQPLSEDDPVENQTLDLSHKFIDNLENQQWDETEESCINRVKLQHNNFRQISKQIFALQNLSFLDISYNQLVSIPKEISQLPIATLILCSNEIESFEFPTELWENSRMRATLQSLDCTMNKLSEYPSFLYDAPELVTLKLGYNKLKQFHNHALTGTPKLRELVLKHNQVETIVVDTESDPVPLRLMSFQDNRISAVPDGFFGSFPKLRVIDLANNRIEYLSSDIHQSKVLREVFLEWNFLETLPDEICHLQSLQQLLLASNCLRSLPHNIGSLTNLGRLDLSGNLITNEGLPSSMSQLENISELLLADNQLNSVPQSLFYFKNLRLLDLAFNNIQEFPAEIMEELNQLCEINLSCNNLTRMPFSSMKQHEMLIRILLGGNGLHHLDFDCIQNAIRIQDISLWGNQLSSFASAAILRKFSFLSLVDVSFNPSLQEMPWDAFMELIQIQLNQIDVQGIHQEEIKLIPSELQELLGRPIVLSPSARFQTSWAHMRGRRPSMEDHMCICGQLSNNRFWDMFGVFDGHAGSDTAYLAATYMPQVIASHLEDGTFNVNECRMSMLKVFEQVNRRIRAEGYGEDGSTAVVALFIEDQLIISNVGDARAVLCRGGSAYRLSVDHKPINPLEHERIIKLGGYVTPSGRVNGDLAVSRSLGDFSLQPFVSCVPSVSKIKLRPSRRNDSADSKNPPPRKQIASEKESRKRFRYRTDSLIELQPLDQENNEKTLFGHDIAESDEFLILACDGVWDVTSDQRAVDIIRSSPNFKTGAKRLRDYAFSCGSSDNISVCIIQF